MNELPGFTASYNDGIGSTLCGLRPSPVACDDRYPVGLIGFEEDWFARVSVKEEWSREETGSSLSDTTERRPYCQSPTVRDLYHRWVRIVVVMIRRCSVMSLVVLRGIRLVFLITQTQ